MTAYYNENDDYLVRWLRNLITARLIPAGDVDHRSIETISPDDLLEYQQCHFFAGIGGWAYAAKLAGWPKNRELWTGSPPCQPWSRAGEIRGAVDYRHLWPHFFRLIVSRRPVTIMGEQVASPAGEDWLNGVGSDLEGIGYEFRAVIVPACSVNAPHPRSRIWFIADRSRREGENVLLADSGSSGRQGWQTKSEHRDQRSPWEGSVALRGSDGRARRVDPSIRLLAPRVSGAIHQISAFGNSVVPGVAAEVIKAFMEVRP